MVKKSDWIVTLVLLFGFIFLIVLFFYISTDYGDFQATLRSPGSKIGIVHLNMPILSSETIVRQVKKFNNERTIKGIVLRVETPGGSVAATQEIYQEVKKVRKNGKKVVVSMGNVAASGGYYIACAADIIMANPSTITGSIGVIAEFPNFAGLFDRIGISFEVIKSGRFKDTGSINREMTEEERDYFQNIINDSYAQFVDVVAQERSLSREEVFKIADGRVFSGRQAKEHSLIDTLGTFEDAIYLAKEISGLSFDAPVVEEKRRGISLFDLLFGDVNEILYILRRNISLNYIMN